jgi:hypothetical protein
MEYIIVLDSTYKSPTLIEDGRYFLQTFHTYIEAKEEALKWVKNGICKDFAIYRLCTDDFVI